MPNDAGREGVRSSPTVNEWMLTAGVLVMLFWGLSIAEPCLVGLLRGDPAANPIAITECHPEITNGDVVVRLAALLLVAALFACTCQLIEPERKSLNVALHAVLGLTIALGIQFVLMTLSPWSLPDPLGAFFLVWITACIAAFLAALAGSAIANTTRE